ncbi:MAG: class I SAM-dependent methyltransferase [bacterium]|jgi:demethylmenaquinone methyltransferase/2-methoxy-6-polyprenyl-1,4-benzoquinol methylase|nr:class I SAM-dependent methyltransferase [bacterium]
MSFTMTSRETAYCGLFGAAALLLPLLFHLLHLGSLFMPMYLPLVALAFFVRAFPAAITAFVVPLLSGAVTGMPPFYPPIALFMALELAVISMLIAALHERIRFLYPYGVLIPVLLFGRVLHVGLVYFFSLFIQLPAGYIAGLSFLKGWPGLILMVGVIPPIVAVQTRHPQPKDTSMPNQAKVDFFNRIASLWDSWDDLAALHTKLIAGIREFGIKPDETIVDIGCGTGNLTTALVSQLAEEGRVHAVDIAPEMIAQAKKKISDPRVTWYLSGAESLPMPDASCDRVICYSVWPHFSQPQDVAAELHRVLKPGGILHIWHLLPRDEINHIHATADPAVHHDHLAPAEEIANQILTPRFDVQTIIDDTERYVITARKKG